MGFTPTSSGSPSTIIDDPTADTWYYVTVSDGCSLDAIDSVQVIINSLPSAFLNAVDSNGCAPFSASFILNTDIGVSFDYDFECDGIIDYSGTSTAPSHTYNDPGIYDVCITITTSSGCETQLIAPGIIEVYPVPIASFSADPWTTTEIDPSITFIDESIGALQYDWNFGDGETVSGLVNDVIVTSNTIGTIGLPVHFFSTPGEFDVTQTVTNQYGCIDQITYTVIVNPEQTIYVPNSFSPNGDGKNDFFVPIGLGLDTENFVMYIFNRWGEQIYEAHSINQPWDGSIKGRAEIAQEDVYVWMVKAMNIDGSAVNLRGHVTLLK